MPEHLYRILLSEITTLRIRCGNPHCQGVVELHVEHIASAMKACSCPLCGHVFDTSRYEGGHLLQLLAEAIRRLKAIEDRVQVEFQLPVRQS